jgi:hypothetical protein
MIWEKRWFQFAILMVLAFVWGSSFIRMKRTCRWKYFKGGGTKIE